jgi:hypothetical protein
MPEKGLQRKEKLKRCRRTPQIIAPQTCIRAIIEIQTMMQLFASAAKLRGGGPILHGGF